MGQTNSEYRKLQDVPQNVSQGGQRTSQSRDFNNTKHTHFSIQPSTQVKKLIRVSRIHYIAKNGTAHVSSFHEVQAFASLFVSILLFSSIRDTHTPISDSKYDEIK